VIFEIEAFSSCAKLRKLNAEAFSGAKLAFYWGFVSSKIVCAAFPSQPLAASVAVF
jgi:hypothetical protein